MTANTFYMTGDERLNISCVDARRVILGLERTIILSYGMSEDVGIVERLVWDASPIDYVFPTTASTLRLTSSLADDTANGTGGRSILIDGLDINYNRITEIVPLNGLGDSFSTQQFFRVNRAIIKTVGSAGKLLGNVSIYHNTNNLISFVANRNGRSQSSVYTVPNNVTLLLTNVTLQSGKAQDVLVRSYVTGPGQPPYSNFAAILYQDILNNEIAIPYPVPPKTDFYFTARAEAGVARVGVSFTGVLFTLN